MKNYNLLKAIFCAFLIATNGSRSRHRQTNRRNAAGHKHPRRMCVGMPR
jgi:hypothetical protein